MYYYIVRGGNMTIKNILVDNIDECINIILKELSKLNISYVYIEESNELHFDKYIFRFFTKKTVFEFLASNIKVQESYQEPVIIENVSINDFINESSKSYRSINMKQQLRNENQKNNRVLKKQLGYGTKIVRR